MILEVWIFFEIYIQYVYNIYIQYVYKKYVENLK